jgi:uncharacterized membrane protein
MDARPRFMASGLTRRQRRVYGAVAVFFLVVFVAMIWPVYALFSGIRPFVLGMPFSLFYVVVWLAASFLVLLVLFAWEGRAEGRDDGRDGGGRDDGAPPEGRP